MIQLNFQDRLKKIKELANIWSSRNLSLLGKIVLIKTFMISKFVYIASIMQTPKHYIKELETFLYRFLWHGKDKVTRKSAINYYERGGLNMIDIELMIQSLRLAWIKRTLNCRNGFWKEYLRYQLRHYGGFLLLSCNYDPDIKLDTAFYQELVNWWTSFRKNNATEGNHKYIIWNNKNIKVETRNAKG